jgi:hypothetical protein
LGMTAVCAKETAGVDVKQPSDHDEDVAVWRRVVIPSGCHCARAALPPDYELRNDLKVVRISETKIVGCSQAAKWVPLGSLL